MRRWSRIHAALFRVTGGLVGRRLVKNDMLLLTTTGRHSGRPHTVPLLYLRDNERLVVIASHGGRDRHPEWYQNLAADPLVSVKTPGANTEMIARTADPAERATWWPRVVGAYDGYEVYQSRTDREIPLVFLQPTN